MRRLTLLLCLGAVALPALARATMPGALFLTIVPDARTLALGHDGVALADLAASTYYNPASIALGPRAAAAWTHWSLYYDISYDHVAMAYRQGEHLCLAAGAAYLQYGEFDAVDERGHLIGRYRNYDLAPGISAAYRFLPSLSAGMTFKGVYSRRWLVMPELGIDMRPQAFTVAIDAGVQYRPLKALTLGLAAANLGPKIRYDTTSGYFLPRIARLGLALSPNLPGPVSAVLTGEVSRDLYPNTARFAWHAGSGLELGFWRLAFVRLGYFRNNRVDKGLTWGFGLMYRGIGLDVGVDEDIYDFPTRNVRFQLTARL